MHLRNHLGAVVSNALMFPPWSIIVHFSFFFFFFKPEKVSSERPRVKYNNILPGWINKEGTKEEQEEQHQEERELELEEKQKEQEQEENKDGG